MAIIFCDGFDHYGTADITKKWDTTMSYWTIDTTKKRSGTGALKFQNGISIATRTMSKSFPGSYATLVWGSGLNVSAIAGGHYGGFRFYDGTTLHIEVRINADLTLAVYRGTTLLGTAAAFCSLDAWNYFEAKVVVSDTTGSVTIRKNGKAFYELTNIDTRNGANSTCNKIELFVEHSTDTGNIYYWDDMYVAEDFLGDVRIETIYPAGAGASAQWDPSTGLNFECVDETPLNETDYISSLTAEDVDTYVFGNLSVAAGTIRALQVNMTAKKDDAGGRWIAPVLRPAATNHIGASQAIGDSYIDYRQVYETNPETSSGWTVADINGAEFGVKLIE